jgi:hypothetical protein
MAVPAFSPGGSGKNPGSDYTPSAAKLARRKI